MEAWRTAAQAIESESSRKKGCPRSTFIGLCESGRIRNIPAGNYGGRPASKNAEYGIKALDTLLRSPELAEDRVLWHAIGNDGLSPNGQMDVVISLWRAGKLILSDPSSSPRIGDFEESHIVQGRLGC